MSIKLKGSTDGSVTLQAPADTSPTGTDKTFTLPTQDGDAGQILKTNGSGALSFTDNLASNRNLLVNGDCRISQRGTSFAIGTGQLTELTVDRFKLSKNSGAALTVTQESDGPAGFNKSIKIATTTADTSLASTEWNILQYNIEGQDLQHLNYGTSDAKSTTLSFWVKSNMTGNLSVSSEVNAGPPFLAGSVAINSANTWEYKTITYIGNTATAINDDNTAGIEFQIWLDAGSGFSASVQNTTSWNSDSGARVNSTNQINLQGSTSNYIQFTGFQYEVGSVATEFEHRSFGDELARCQRYCHKYGGDGSSDSQYSRFPIGVNSGTTQHTVGIPHPVSMRSCTKSILTSVAGVQIYSPGTNINTTSPTFSLDSDGQSFDVGYIIIGGFTGLTSDITAAARVFNDSDFHIIFDAEL